MRQALLARCTPVRLAAAFAASRLLVRLARLSWELRLTTVLPAMRLSGLATVCAAAEPSSRHIAAAACRCTSKFGLL